MWDLSGPGLEPMSPALAGGFLTTALPGKPHLFLFYSVLVGCMFLETCPFPLGCPTCWHIIVHIVFLWFFVFLQCQLLFFPFISYFVHLGPLSFLLGEPGQRFIDFVYPFKKLALGFINFFHCFFLISLLFISSLIFTVSFLQLTLGFACSSFLILLGGRLGCLFEIFLIFEEDLYCCELPS